MSDQDTKSVDFNPLDILASAAATLKQVDKSTNSTMTQQKTQQRKTVTPATERRSNTNNKSDSNVTTEGAKSSSKNQDNNGVKKIVVTTLSSDLEKMLDEHNYGNSRKNLLGKTLTDGNLPGGSSGSSDTKDRKVVVTVVNKTGDHHVIRTINSIKHQSSDIDNSCDKTADIDNLPKAVELATDKSKDRCSKGEQVNQGVTDSHTDNTIDVDIDNCLSGAIITASSTTQSTGSTSLCRSYGASDNENDGSKHQINNIIDTLSQQHDNSDVKTETSNENCSENETDLLTKMFKSKKLG